MNAKNFVLSYYQNSTEYFHIQKVENAKEARNPHTHEYFQIYYVLKGGLTHHLENQSSHLVHGDTFIIPPSRTHYVSPDKGAVFYSFSFTPEFVNEQNKSSRLARNFLSILQSDARQPLPPKISLSADQVFQVENLFNQLLKEFTEKPLGYSETVCSYTVILLTALARNYFEKEHASASEYFEDDKQFVLHCIDYVEENFTDKLLLCEICKRFGVSKSNFCALFKKITGYSFNAFVNRRRIKQATALINGGYKMDAIAGICGYDDFSTFYRNFKKITGVSPKDFKSRPNH